MDIKAITDAALKILGLVFINALAFIYDGNYIPLAIGFDALALGYSLKPSALNVLETKIASDASAK